MIRLPHAYLIPINPHFPIVKILRFFGLLHGLRKEFFPTRFINFYGSFSPFSFFFPSSPHRKEWFNSDMHSNGFSRFFVFLFRSKNKKKSLKNSRLEIERRKSLYPNLKLVFKKFLGKPRNSERAHVTIIFFLLFFFFFHSRGN